LDHEKGVKSGKSEVGVWDTDITCKSLLIVHDALGIQVKLFLLPVVVHFKIHPEQRIATSSRENYNWLSINYDCNLSHIVSQIIHQPLRTVSIIPLYASALCTDNPTTFAPSSHLLSLTISPQSPSLSNAFTSFSSIGPP
jgi:hypothetical protein